MSYSKLKYLFGESILDVASGDGRSLLYFIRNIKSFDRAIGIDIDKTQINAANYLFRSFKNIQFKVMDASSLQFKDQEFDLVLINNSLHHLLDIKKSICEMYRVLKENGHLVIIEQISGYEHRNTYNSENTHDWFVHADKLLGFKHEYYFTKDYMLSMLNKYKFEEINTSEYEGIFIPAYAEYVIYISMLMDRKIESLKYIKDCTSILNQGKNIKSEILRKGLITDPEMHLICRK